MQFNQKEIEEIYDLFYGHIVNSRAKRGKGVSKTMAREYNMSTYQFNAMIRKESMRRVTERRAHIQVLKMVESGQSPEIIRKKLNL